MENSDDVFRIRFEYNANDEIWEDKITNNFFIYKSVKLSGEVHWTFGENYNDYKDDYKEHFMCDSVDDLNEKIIQYIRKYGLSEILN